MKPTINFKSSFLFFGLCGLLWCLPASLKASQRPELPQGFLLQSAPEFSKWLEEFTYHPPDGQPDKAPSPSFIKSISNTKTKEIVFTSYSYFSGNMTPKWEINKNVFLKPQGQSYWSYYAADSIAKPIINSSDSPQLSSQEFEALVRAAKDPETLPMPETGFSGLEWIDSSAFAS